MGLDSGFTLLSGPQDTHLLLQSSKESIIQPASEHGSRSCPRTLLIGSSQPRGSASGAAHDVWAPLPVCWKVYPMRRSSPSSPREKMLPVYRLSQKMLWSEPYISCGPGGELTDSQSGPLPPPPARPIPRAAARSPRDSRLTSASPEKNSFT